MVARASGLRILKRCALRKPEARATEHFQSCSALTRFASPASITHTQGALMQYTNLGRTGIKVSRLCLGTMNFGPYTTEPDSFAIMDKALELGFNFFDTANVYGWKKGEGVTEQIVGRWLAQGGRREKIVVATKVYGRMGSGPNDVRLSATIFSRRPPRSEEH